MYVLGKKALDGPVLSCLNLNSKLGGKAKTQTLKIASMRMDYPFTVRTLFLQIQALHQPQTIEHHPLPHFQ